MSGYAPGTRAGAGTLRWRAQARGEDARAELTADSASRPGGAGAAPRGLRPVQAPFPNRYAVADLRSRNRAGYELANLHLRSAVTTQASSSLISIPRCHSGLRPLSTPCCEPLRSPRWAPGSDPDASAAAGAPAGKTYACSLWHTSGLGGRRVGTLCRIAVANRLHAP
jgi:hypothetical protein